MIIACEVVFDKHFLLTCLYYTLIIFYNANIFYKNILWIIIFLFFIKKIF